MKTVSKSLTAKDLPPEWQKEGEFAPDDRVTITVEQEDPAQTQLREGLDQAAAELDRGEGMPFDKKAVEELIAEVDAEIAQSR